MNIHRNRLYPGILISAPLIAGLLLGFLLGRGGSKTTPLQVSGAKQLYTCGMHPQVVQDHPGTCPICHMKLVPMRDDGSGSEAQTSDNHQPKERKIKYYWDPMLGPSSISDKPGKSAMGMDLVPVYEDGEASGPAVRIDPTVVQNMGIRTAEVTLGPLTKSIRAVGILSLPESGLYDVSLKVSGWVEKLYADKEGMHIEKGEPIFEIYSPELQLAEEELLSAEGTGGESKESGAIFESAKQKLKFWDISNQDIEALLKSGQVARSTMIRSPATGHIEEKAIVQGSSVQPGMKLFRIADHSKLWFEAQVYAEDISQITLNQAVELVIDGALGESYQGPIIFIYPHLDHMTRTVRVRIEISNPNFELKPGMYGTAFIKTKSAGEVIQVPREAVINTGEKQFAFVAKDKGEFEPRNVRMGTLGDDDRLEIKEGLSPGETVVTSGQFLLDVESRTTEAIQKLRRASTVSTSHSGAGS